MKDMEKKPCNCKIEGKQYEENDETCIECKRSQEVLDILFNVALERAIKSGDLSFLEILIKETKL